VAFSIDSQLVHKIQVVLEGSWSYCCTMATQIAQYRAAQKLAPLRSVTLRSNITGEYWRFHDKGHSAVSTIEAIAHTAEVSDKVRVDATLVLWLYILNSCTLR
jgi:hypothetical protein